jgi:RHS repeat-associated protein
VYGLDLNETFGGLQGIGGLKLIIAPKAKKGRLIKPVIDLQGNVMGYFNHGGVYWTKPDQTRSRDKQKSFDFYDPYGPLVSENRALEDYASEDLGIAIALTHTWRGKRQDSTGLIWMGTRYYDPFVGRFISPDPLGNEGSMDLYSYANGNPVVYCDPDGRFFSPMYAHRGEFFQHLSSYSGSGRYSSMGAVLTGANTLIANPNNSAVSAFSFVLDFTAVGNFRAGFEMLSGYDTITGESLSDFSRGSVAAGFFLGGIGKWGGKGLNVLRSSEWFGKAGAWSKSLWSRGGSAAGQNFGKTLVRETSPQTTIIGETMKRVEIAASQVSNAKILNDMPDFASQGMVSYELTSAMMQYNRSWILNQIRQGGAILDIGKDVNRATPSIFYQMEQNMLKNYKQIHPEWNNHLRTW